MVIVLTHQLRMSLLSLEHFYTYLSHVIAPIFNQVGLGRIVHQVILLTLIPVMITLVPALAYKLIKGHFMPYFIPLTWCVWLTLTLCVIIK